VCEDTHIIRDYETTNLRVNAGFDLLLYVCVAHTNELNSSQAKHHPAEKNTQKVNQKGNFY